MVFKYEDWNLYYKDIKLKGGKTQRIYFFCKGKPKSGTPCDKPDNYFVSVNPRGGLPNLKKKR
jgi:hypothetical protein